jgi:hypothetical protein
LPSYGLIVEGEADKNVFDQLIRKVNSPDASIYPLTCGGVGRFMKMFPDLLLSFKYMHNGGSVDGALVIRDCDNKSAQDVLSRMQEKLGNRTYNFPRGIEFCVVNRNLDSWLLADERAINEVSRARQGRPVARVNETIEEITHPKERLQGILNEAKLVYTPAVLGEIAAAINLQDLEYRVPSFVSFKESVLRIYRPDPLL